MDWMTTFGWLEMLLSGMYAAAAYWPASRAEMRMFEVGMIVFVKVVSVYVTRNGGSSWKKWCNGTHFKHILYYYM